MARPRARTAAGFPALATGLLALSWAALLVWEATPYGRYLHHGDWASAGLAGTICTVVPGGAWLVPGLLYTGGWLLMTAAMMLPTTLPLVRLFDRMIAVRADRTALHGLLIAGYLTVWAGFGVAAHVLDRALHAALADRAWVIAHAEVPGAVILAVAGAFQFSALKYHCLDKCRTPLGFVTSHWHGPRPWRAAFRLGLSHGAYCVGCCWALMLLMFVVGTGSLGWMLLLGLVMAVEKNHPWGRHLSKPIGGILLAGAGFVLLRAMA